MQSQRLKHSTYVDLIAFRTLPRHVLPHFDFGIPAGFPSPAADHIQNKLSLDELLIKHPAATFFAYAKGDSMKDAGINDGDLLVIDRAEEPAHKSIVVALLDGEYVCKRLWKQRGVVKLLSENPAYEPMVVTENMDAVVWGVVTNVIHKVR